MNRRLMFLSILGVAIVVLVFLIQHSSISAASDFPYPAVDEKLAEREGHSKIVLAGGCFWGLQAVFEHDKGVNQVTAGYSGGTVKNPNYEEVSTETGHAEAVEIEYDQSKISVGMLLKIFFSVAHDPTELNRQDPDVGTQYRSAIFFETEEQQRVAQAYVERLNQAKLFSNRIVTQIVPFQSFYRAETYHQEYATQYPDDARVLISQRSGIFSRSSRIFITDPQGC